MLGYRLLVVSSPFLRIFSVHFARPITAHMVFRRMVFYREQAPANLMSLPTDVTNEALEVLQPIALVTAIESQDQPEKGKD